MQIHIITYGCQMNERDSERLAGALRRRGHELAAGEDSAGAVIVNTCSVRARAEAKALGKLRLLVAAKRCRPGLLVGAAGCMVQVMGAELLRQVPGLDLAVGTQAWQRLPGLLELAAAGQGPWLDTGLPDGAPDEGEPDGREPGRPTAWINVLYGCNRRCAYCIVPRARGAERSRPAAEIVAEARRLAAGGVREITLLGQSVTSYGHAHPVWPAAYRSPRGFREPLPRLLEALQDVPGLARLRFTSSHPDGCTAELARTMAELPAVCEHLHLPLQSGADRILARMRRGYTAAAYGDAVRRLRAAVPGLALTTDLIVGFPSETPEEFAQTLARVEEIRFDNAFIFKYSPRPGTPAAGWPDDLPPAEKACRHRRLLDRQNQICLEINRGLEGRELEVLAEGPSQRNPARWTGRTRANKIVLFAAAPGLRRGALITARIEQARVQTLHGAVVAVRD